MIIGMVVCWTNIIGITSSRNVWNIIASRYESIILSIWIAIKSLSCFIEQYLYVFVKDKYWVSSGQTKWSNRQFSLFNISSHMGKHDSL